MRARVLLAATALLLVATGIARGQDDASYPFEKTFSIEVGTGYPPLQMLAPRRAAQRQLAPKGQDVDPQDAFCPVASLTGVYRSSLKTEVAMTAGVSWYRHKLIQHPSFGIDPNGNPRYDLDRKENLGWTNSIPSYSLSFQVRHLWNPDKDFVVYSALGAGLVLFSNQTRVSPMPALTPVAFRYWGNHLYAFAEMTFGPAASLLNGGVGWRF